VNSSCNQVETGSGYRALCRWISQRSPESSYISTPDDAAPASPHPSPPFPGSIGVYSSGSTGKPKLIWKDINRLENDCSRHTSHKACTWATCFAPSSFAGVQVAAQAMVSGGNILPLGKKWTNNRQLLFQSQPEILAATPTFLHLLQQALNHSLSERWQPRQITLGGEPIRPTTEHILQNQFPTSRVTLIYASAEMGIIAKSHRKDGWYPIRFLRQRFDGWRQENGELQLLRNNDWIKTGDHCEVNDDHFRIVGRMDRVIHVGGFKVCLDDIETMAESFSEVSRALAFAKENPVTGHVVALVLESSKPFRNQVMLDNILENLRKRLPKPAWPRWTAWGKVRALKNGKRILLPDSNIT
jgi:acyl-CoA synthetase (AMP-forming)/AMP-acid ligase II